MTLCKTGQGITDIKGGTGGVYFHRDKSGLHMNRKPRVIHRRSIAQDKQRKAFTNSRTYCFTHQPANAGKDWLNRCVSFNIYRALNDLTLQNPPTDYQIPTLKAPPTTRPHRPLNNDSQ